MSMRTGRITTSHEVIYPRYDPNNFIGRKWLIKKVESFRDDPQGRHLIIIGEPGSGKSAFLAYLSEKWNAPRHFIRVGSMSGVTGVAPRSFLISIGAQLYQKYGRSLYDQNEGSKTSVTVGIAKNKSEVTGRFIQELYTLPFLPLSKRNVDVKVAAAFGESKVVGEQIGRLIDVTESLSERELLHVTLLNPLRRLYEFYPSEKVVIFVDALDESLFYPGTKIGDVLPRAADQGFPPNLRLVITSRPDDYLVNFRPEDQLRLDRFNDKTHEDINEYIKNALNKDPFNSIIATWKETELKQYIESIETSCDNNFLYLYHYFDELREFVLQGEKDIRQFKIPKGLNEIYRFFAIERIRGNLMDTLHFNLSEPLPASLIKHWQEVDGVEQIIASRDAVTVTTSDCDRTLLRLTKSSWRAGIDIDEEKIEILRGTEPGLWEEKYLPTLGILAVIYEPVTPAQIANLASIKPAYVYTIISQLKQFLDQYDGKYQLYHRSFGEYLTDKNRNYDYPLHGPCYHSQIASYYLGQNSTWNDIDWDKAIDTWSDYPWRHLLKHVYHWCDASSFFNKLFELADSNYLNAKLNKLSSPELINDDLELVYFVCDKVEDITNLAKFGLTKIYLTNSTNIIKISGLPKLILLTTDPRYRSQVLTKFLSAARLIPNLVTRSRVLRQLFQDCHTIGYYDPRLERLLNDARDNLLKMPEASDRSYQMLQLVKATSEQQMDHHEIAEDLIRNMAVNDSYRAEAWAALAQGYYSVGNFDEGARCLISSLESFRETNLFGVSKFFDYCSLLGSEQALRLAEKAVAIAETYTHRNVLYASRWDADRFSEFSCVTAGLLARANRHQDAENQLKSVFEQFYSPGSSEGKWFRTLRLSNIPEALAEFSNIESIDSIWEKLRKALVALNDEDFVRGGETSVSNGSSSVRRLASKMVLAKHAHYRKGIISPADALFASVNIMPVELGDYGCDNELKALIQACEESKEIEPLLALQEMLETMKPPKSRARIASLLANSYISLGHNYRAKDLFQVEQSLLAAVSPKEYPGAAIALAGIALSLSEDKEIAEALTETAFDKLTYIMDDFDRENCITDIIESTSILLDRPFAARILKKAIEHSDLLHVNHRIFTAVSTQTVDTFDQIILKKLVTAIETSLNRPKMSSASIAAAAIAAEAFFRIDDIANSKKWLRLSNSLLLRVVDEGTKWQVGHFLARTCLLLNAEDEFHALLDTALKFRIPEFGSRLLGALSWIQEDVHITKRFSEILAKKIREFLSTSGQHLDLATMLQTADWLATCTVDQGFLQEIDIYSKMEIENWETDEYGIGIESFLRAQSQLSRLETLWGLDKQAESRLKSIEEVWLPRLQRKNIRTWAVRLDELANAILVLRDSGARNRLTKAVFEVAKTNPCIRYNFAYGMSKALNISAESFDFSELIDIIHNELQLTVNTSETIQEYQRYCAVRALSNVSVLVAKIDATASQSLFDLSLRIVAQITGEQERAWSYRELLDACPVEMSLKTQLEKEVLELIPLIGNASSRSDLAEAWLKSTATDDSLQMLSILGYVVPSGLGGSMNLIDLFETLSKSQRPLYKKTALILRGSTQYLSDWFFFSLALTMREFAVQNKGFPPELDKLIAKIAGGFMMEPE